MKEIKYINHFSRNIFIYFFIFLINSLLFKTPMTIQIFFVGLFTYFIAYAPVYFLNDFADYKEDSKYKKSNLYLLFQKENIFWVVTFLLLILGFVLSFIITPLSIVFLLILYFLNFIYSYPPLRLRNRLYFREFVIFSIYSVKCWLVLLYLHQSLINFPFIIVIMGSLFSSYAMTLYKRHKGKVVSDFIFGIPFIITWCWTIIVYKQLFWMFFPLAPIGLYLFIKYKDKKIPIPLGLSQLVYFTYCIFIYILNLHS